MSIAKKTTKKKRIKKDAVYADNIKPEIGMGVTCGSGSDRYPYTVVAINKTGKTIKITSDSYQFIRNVPEKIVFDRYEGHYEYTSHMGVEYAREYSLRKDGHFYPKGSKARYGAAYLGSRSYYQDPSF